MPEVDKVWSTLQKLQSLDKDYNDFDTQLTELAERIEISLDAYTATALDKTADGRLDWALRWLLNKLRASTGDGTQARSSTQGWTILSNIFGRLQPFLIARVLISHKFLSILEEAAQEACSKYRHISNGKVCLDDHITQHDSESTLPVVESYERPNENMTRKRKRGKDVSPSTAPKQREVIDNEKGPTLKPSSSSIAAMLDHFRALELCLHRLVLMATEDSDVLDTYSRQYLQSALRTDAAQAARLLEQWLTMKILQNSLPRLESKEANSDASLSDVLYIWNCSSILSGDFEEGKTLLFSQHCLLPAIRFLCIDRQRRTSSLSESADRGDFLQVERLLAQHVLIPSKKNFHESRQRKASDVTSPRIEGMSISKLLEPFRKAISGRARTYTDKILVTDVAGVLILFETAIRCSFVSSLNKRIVDSPWIQAVFIELAACLGFEIHEAHSKELPVENLEAFEELLRLAARNKVSFADGYVSTMAARFVNSDFSSTETLRWAVLAQLIALDINAFISPRPISDDESEAVEQYLYSQILSAITAQGWVSSDQNLNMGLKGGLGSNSYQAYNRYVEIKTKVVFPLMKAYITVRDARSFLTYWQRELTRFHQQTLIAESQHASGTTLAYKLSVWQDQDLDKELARFLGTSFTTRQITDVVGGLLSKLGFENGTSLKNEEIAELKSSLHILHAIFSGLSDEAVVKILERQIFELIQRCILLLKSPQVEIQSVRSNAWALIAKCHSLVFSCSDLTTIEEHKIDFGLIMQQVTESIRCFRSPKHRGDLYEGLQAIDCLGCLNNDIRRRHLSYDPTIRVTSQLLAPLQDIFCRSETRVDTTDVCYLAGVLSKYPGLLDPEEREVDDHERDRLALLPRIGLNLLNFMDVEDLNLWQHFIQHAQDECKSLIEEISKSAAKSFNSLKADVGNETFVLEEACLALRPNLITRANRQQILDGAAAKLLNRKSSPSALTWARSISLMMRLLEVPVGSAAIMNSVECLWNLALALDEAISSGQVDSENSISILALFKELARTILQYHTNNRTTIQSEQYLQQCFTKAKSLPGKTGPLHSQPAVLGLFVLTCNAVIAFKKMHEPLLEIEASTFIAISSRICSELDEQLKHVSSDNGYVRATFPPAMILLDAVSNLHTSILLQNQENVGHTINNWASSVLKSEYLNQKVSMLPLAALVFKASCSHDACRCLPPSMLNVLLLSQQRLSAHDRGIIHQAFMGAVVLIDSAEREEVIKQLLTFRSYQETELAKMDLLHTLVAASRFKAYSSLIPADTVSLITTTISEHLPQTLKYESFHLQSATLHQLLLRHSKSQTQLAVDAALLAIIKSCSPSGPPLPKHHAPKIFTAITRVLLALLTHHRRALRGRFDILLLALQSLLRCLFVPTPQSASNSNNPHTTSTSLRHALPAWAPTTRAAALTATHASLYTRLLTTLCDPTLASIRPSGPSTTTSNLTDATKKARNYAGQYAPLILLELCRCLLVGRLGGDGSVREALLPGVWAVFDVVERDVLAAAAEGMPGAERAILKGLREEWRRVGGRRGRVGREGRRG